MITIFLAGDSTCAYNSQETYPQTGWGQKLGDFLRDNVSVSNHAVNGRSTKSFLDQGRLRAIEEEIQPGDYLFIQFGHNDQKDDPERHCDAFTSYRENLETFIRIAREKGAHPVLLTSLYRRHFENGILLENVHFDYPDAMRVTGREQDVPVIDLTAITIKWLQETGDEASKDFFMVLPPEMYANYPEGLEDNTHLTEKGASLIASFIAREMAQFSGLKALIKEKE